MTGAPQEEATKHRAEITRVVEKAENAKVFAVNVRVASLRIVLDDLAASAAERERLREALESLSPSLQEIYEHAVIYIREDGDRDMVCETIRAAQDTASAALTPAPPGEAANG